MNARAQSLRFLRRSWDTVCLALAVVGMLTAALPLSHLAGWIPRVVLLTTLALVVAQLVIEFREVGPITISPEQPRLPPMRPTGPVVVVLWVVGLMLAVLLLGTVAGSAFFCVAYLRWHAHETWLTSGAVALALGAGVLLIFSVMLRAQLHAGWLWSFAS